MDTVVNDALGTPESNVTDKMTEKIEKYLETYLFLDHISVTRKSIFNKKIIIDIGSSSTEIYRFGQIVKDCTRICETAIKNEKQELSYVFIMAHYENGESMFWRTENFKEGKLGTLSTSSSETMPLEKVVETYSPKNKDLPKFKPLIPVDPYALYDLDKTDFSPELLELQEFLDRNISGIDYVLVENGRDNPDELYIEVFATRFASQEFGAIIQDAVEVGKEAMKMTDKKIERFTATMMLKGKENAEQSMQWITDDFVNGTAWDDFNGIFPEDGKDISLKDVVAFYSPDNKNLK
jgi:hypothetical protein